MNAICKVPDHVYFTGTSGDAPLSFTKKTSQIDEPMDDATLQGLAALENVISVQQVNL